MRQLTRETKRVRRTRVKRRNKIPSKAIDLCRYECRYRDGLRSYLYCKLIKNRYRGIDNCFDEVDGELKWFREKGERNDP